jgi:hypothetical protein
MSTSSTSSRGFTWSRVRNLSTLGIFRKKCVSCLTDPLNANFPSPLTWLSVRHLSSNLRKQQGSPVLSFQCDLDGSYHRAKHQAAGGGCSSLSGFGNFSNLSLHDRISGVPPFGFSLAFWSCKISRRSNMCRTNESQCS